MPCWNGAARDKLLDVVRQVAAVHVTARLNFEGDLRRHVLGPVLQRIEGDDPDGIIELTLHQLANRGFQIGPLDFDLAARCPGPSNTVYDQLKGLVRAIRHTHG